MKILFQTSNPRFEQYQRIRFGLLHAIGDIYNRDRFVGLFRGHSATLLKIYPYAAIKFIAYEQYRAILIGGRRVRETWVRRFGAGALAGVTSVFVTYPLEMIRVRLAYETKRNKSSLSDICKQIYNETQLPKLASEVQLRKATPLTATTSFRFGLMNFYRGFSTTMMGMVPYAGVSFMTHDIIGDLFRVPAVRKYTTLPHKTASQADQLAPLTAWAELTAGGISGAVAQTVSYPLEIIRRRMQVAGAVGDGHRLRIGETVRLIYSERGIRGFYVGLTIGYVKVVPMMALGFYVYKRASMVLGI